MTIPILDLSVKVLALAPSTDGTFNITEPRTPGVPLVALLVDKAGVTRLPFSGVVPSDEILDFCRDGILHVVHARSVWLRLANWQRLNGFDEDKIEANTFLRARDVADVFYGPDSWITAADRQALSAPMVGAVLSKPWNGGYEHAGQLLYELCQKASGS